MGGAAQSFHAFTAETDPDSGLMLTAKSADCTSRPRRRMAKLFAFLYTDPGSGLLLWQVLLGAFVGVGFYFRRILTFFGIGRNRKE